MYDDNNKWSGYEHDEDEKTCQGSTPTGPDPQTEPVYRQENAEVNFTMGGQEDGQGQQDGGPAENQDSTYGSTPDYRSYIPEEPTQKPRKRKSVAGKAAGIAAAGILFGCVAGGTMWGVNAVAEKMTKETYPQVSQSETMGDASGATTAQAGTSGEATTMAAVSSDVSAIVDKAMPSVVAINNTMLYQSNSFFGSQTYEVPSSGSGIIVGQNDSDLLIVTNNHVVEDSTSLQVTFIDGSSVDAEVKGTDSDSDLAIVGVPLANITAETMGEIKAATLGNSDDLKVGQGVIAIGNALGYGQSVTVGYVSALNREVNTDSISRTLLQTDAAINPGNSGGALLNMKGEVIGINAAKYSSTEVEGMGYAIPISFAQDIMQNLMNKAAMVKVEEDKQGYLGIQLQNIDKTMANAYGMPQGIYVYKIVEGGAASKSDLRERDIITRIDDYDVKTGQDLQDMLTYYKSGSKVTLTVQSLENGSYVERKVEVTLGEKPETTETKQ